MATQKEAIDLPIYMHGLSISDDSLMQTHATKLYDCLRKCHCGPHTSSQTGFNLTAICSFTAHYFDFVLFSLSAFIELCCFCCIFKGLLTIFNFTFLFMKWKSSLKEHQTDSWQIFFLKLFLCFKIKKRKNKAGLWQHVERGSNKSKNWIKQ